VNGAWGYCKWCAFEVPVGSYGRLLFHERGHFIGGKATCPGSGQELTPQPGPEAEPLALVSLHKTARHFADRKKRADQQAHVRVMQARLAALRDISIEVIASGGD
jgi:hypothetical protein